MKRIISYIWRKIAPNPIELTNQELRKMAIQKWSK